MTIDLKRCPFCGGGAAFWNAGMFGEGYRVAVKCRSCEARVPSGTCETPEEAERVAAEGWNSRAERTCRMSPDALASAALGAPAMVCSGCGASVPNIVPVHYCPNCGARAVVDDDR